MSEHVLIQAQANIVEPIAPVLRIRLGNRHIGDNRLAQLPHQRFAGFEMMIERRCFNAENLGHFGHGEFIGIQAPGGG